MEVDPGGEIRSGSGLEREFLDLALSMHGAVRWTYDFASDEVTWAEGMDSLLGVPRAGHAELSRRLRGLVEPLVVSARTTPLWEDFDLEQPVDTAEDGQRLLHFHARAHGEGTRTSGLIGLVRNVTGAHRDRQALSDLADRYRLLAELSPDAICVHQDNIIRYVNPAMGTILGAQSPAQLLGRPVTDFVAPDSIPQMRKRIRSLEAPGATTPRAEAELRRIDGTTVPVELVAVHTTWEGSSAVQVVGRDVSAQKTAEETLRFQAALVQHVSNAIIATDRSGIVTSWNPAAEAVYGIAEEEALARHVADLVGAPLQPEELVSSGGVTEALHRRSDGAALVIRISAAEMDSGFVLVCADETARRRAEQDFATVVAALDEGVVVVGRSGVIESANPASQRILGAPASQIIGTRPTSWPTFDESGAAMRPEEQPSSLAQWTGEPENSRMVRLVRPDGRSVWLSLTSRSLTPQDRPPHMVVTSFTDITDSRAARERLEYEATHDPLTGLANRTLALRHLAVSRDRTRAIAVLFIDLDNFKLINDSLGHGVGDDVLRIVGERLFRTSREEDLVGRLGGDEFVVLVHDESDDDVLRELATGLLAALTEPIHVQGRQLHVNGSIGIVLSRPGDTRAGPELLRDADVAMYQAKTRGGGRYEFFDVELRESMQRSMVLEQDLRHAVQQDQLWVAYQRVVDLRDERTVGVEGLLRWTHPVHGTVSPGEFIPLAEQSDLINSIGAHMLRMATRQVAAERERGGEGLRLNANLSPRQLDDPYLQVLVKQALTDAGLPAHALCLEVTENAIMHDPAASARVLSSLRELGVRLAIDDFGTGYSSLAQLRRLPLDTLKIDRSFVTDLDSSEELRVMINSIVAMAHAVGLDVVAEGVETARQLDLLGEVGCDQAQGFYLGRPGPIERLRDHW
ncbi:sensor domain-containing protein [Saccharopolyspora erythraea]|uniref:sensor domain-containing protein n=1 Tax=Saccharopolyspora erythraea TaxID=1836 RepID=UPI00038D054B|nr:EAL domain-containing protein [Saccharopolyspora erythraea]EQD82519.1 histidine kinase [Saccharopolyspora erythraea D]QRK92541.1 EAL domain-containing protein [Saccharopolyspora erythraea]